MNSQIESKNERSKKYPPDKNMGSFLNSLFDIIFPSACIKCEKSIGGGETICQPCLKNIPTNKSLLCGECEARLPCNKKICHFDFPYILGAAADYKNETTRNLVRELKFGFVKNAARPLANMLVAYAENLNFIDDNWFVVPIPLGKSRLRKRGFNQSLLIAEFFAGHFSLPIEKKILVRSKETKPQSEMKNSEARLKNIKGCFAVAVPEKVAGRNIILIDDVSTSGATFLEAASSLKKSGAKKIIALAAAKG